MTDDNSNLVDIKDDLNEFENEFFQIEPVAPVETAEDETDDEQELLDNLGADDDNPPATEDEEDEEVEETPPPKKKSPLQERIDELTAKAREAERREAETKSALERRIAELEAKSKQDEPEPKKVEVRDILPDEAPNPDAIGENGEPLYPLGEFDPKYIKALTAFSVEQELAKARETAERQQAQEAYVAEITKVQEEWNARIEEKREELPDFSDKVQSMVTAFDGIDPGYGDYLALTVMQSEAGPEILYYLADNIGEAQKIVASGPAAATLAIGRLEAMLSKPKTEKKSNKVSEAPTPPEARSRGSGGKFTVSPDTDDLDAFEKEFFR